jgi:hypothetical protein
MSRRTPPRLPKQFSNGHGNLLKKATKSEGGLEIIDPRGSLTLVQGQGRSGFVPSEMLERKTPTQEAKVTGIHLTQPAHLAPNYFNVRAAAESSGKSS